MKKFSLLLLLSATSIVYGLDEITATAIPPVTKSNFVVIGLRKLFKSPKHNKYSSWRKPWGIKEIELNQSNALYSLIENDRRFKALPIEGEGSGQKIIQTTLKIMTEYAYNDPQYLCVDYTKTAKVIGVIGTLAAATYAVVYHPEKCMQAATKATAYIAETSTNAGTHFAQFASKLTK